MRLGIITIETLKWQSLSTPTHCQLNWKPKFLSVSAIETAKGWLRDLHGYFLLNVYFAIVLTLPFGCSDECAGPSLSESPQIMYLIVIIVIIPTHTIVSKYKRHTYPIRFD